HRNADDLVGGREQLRRHAGRLAAEQHHALVGELGVPEVDAGGVLLEHQQDLAHQEGVGDADDGAHVERVARPQDRHAERAPQLLQAGPDLVDRQLEGRDLHRPAVVAVGAAAWAAAVPPTKLARKGTGIRTPANTTTITQKRSLRLGGSGWSSTGGWLIPPEAARTIRIMRYHRSQGMAA